MIRDRRLKTALATFMAAFAIAHLMQFGLTAGRTTEAADTSRGEVQAVGRAGLFGAAEPLTALPSIGDREPAPPLALGPQRRVPVDMVATPVTGQTLSAYGLPCERVLSVLPAPGAVLRLRLSATCDPRERVEIDHAGLRFALVTDMFGMADTVIPVLATDAELRVVLQDGEALSARVFVPEASQFDRVAVSSDGRSALEIHAFEFGAGYGDTGHVHHGSNASAAQGRVRRLGDSSADDPLIAEIYTFPTGESLASGTVRLHVEGEVTSENCGREVVADAVQSMPGGPPSVVALRVSMPGCDATGDILVLKNVLRDLRIARN